MPSVVYFDKESLRRQNIVWLRRFIGNEVVDESASDDDQSCQHIGSNHSEHQWFKSLIAFASAESSHKYLDYAADNKRPTCHIGGVIRPSAEQNRMNWPRRVTKATSRKQQNPEKRNSKCDQELLVGFHVGKSSKAADGFGLFKYSLSLKTCPYGQHAVY